MTLKLEENELLAALLTAELLTYKTPPQKWREVYQEKLREFIELNKAETESRMRDGETK